MATELFKIPRATDKVVFDVFVDLGGKFNFPRASFTAYSGIQMDFIFGSPPSENLQALLALDSLLIDRATTALDHLTIYYYRGGNAGPDKKSPVYDEIGISYENRPDLGPPPAIRLQVIAFLNERFKRVELGQVTEADASPEIAHVLAIHQSNLQRLEHLNENLAEKGADFRLKLEQQFDEKAAKAQADLARERAQDAERLEERHAELDKQRTALEEKLKALDDRDNTHARREIRNRMLNDVKARIQNFGVSTTTEKKRRPVELAMIGLCFVILVLVGFTAMEILRFDDAVAARRVVAAHAGPTSVSQAASGVTASSASYTAFQDDRTSLYWLWVRLSVFSLSLIGSIIYYIKWQNRWAEQHATSEFQLQQFYIDVNRANWVIESCLEWKKNTDSGIPQELLAAITNGLFVNPATEPERVIHPADELASALLGSASKAKVKVGDSELEFDKPGKSIPKAASASP